MGIQAQHQTLMAEHDDIIKALMILRSAFRKAGLKVPVALVLEDCEEGMRLRHYLKDAFELRQFLEEDVRMSSVKVMGIELKWAAQHYIGHDGEVTYF